MTAVSVSLFSIKTSRSVRCLCRPLQATVPFSSPYIMCPVMMWSFKHGTTLSGGDTGIQISWVLFGMPKILIGFRKKGKKSQAAGQVSILHLHLHGTSSWIFVLG